MSSPVGAICRRRAVPSAITSSKRLGIFLLTGNTRSRPMRKRRLSSRANSVFVRCTCGNCTKCRRRGANRSGFLDCSNISRNCWSGPNLVQSTRSLRTNRACRVCKMLRESEAAYVIRLRDFLRNPAGRETYSRSNGVCLRHLDHLLSLAPEDVASLVRATASRAFRKLAAQMHGYAAKREAVRRDLITKEEEDASFRAIAHLAGARDYSAP